MERIVVIDDCQLFAEGMKQILMQDKNSNVKIFNSKKVTIEDIERFNPDFVLIDDSNSVSLLKFIRYVLKELPHTSIIMLTLETDKKRIWELLNLGVNGYLLKDTNIHTLYECLDVVNSGQIYLHYKISNLLLSDQQHADIKCLDLKNSQKNIMNSTTDHLLTKREFEILQLLTEGLSNREISQDLLISEATVKNHVSNIITKFKVSDRLGIVLKALKNGWVHINHNHTKNDEQNMQH